MLPKKVLKYLLDIESVISELEQIIALHEKDFDQFSSSFISIRAVERDFMIIGEAINHLTKEHLKISSTKQIVGLRNMIVHAYDAIDPTLLWRILIKDIPVLKQEVADLKS